jgi:hypothetical protein
VYFRKVREYNPFMRKFRILVFEVIGLALLVAWLMWKYPEVVDDIIPWVALAITWHLTWEFGLDTEVVRGKAIAIRRRVNRMWIWPLVFFVGGSISLLYWVGINKALIALATAARHKHTSDGASVARAEQSSDTGIELHRVRAELHWYRTNALHSPDPFPVGKPLEFQVSF